MEISQLRAILALRELASLVRAGEQLHLSPSAVFCQIRQLEDETGQKLYERIGKRLRLTDAGEFLLEHAKKIIETHDGALAWLKEHGTGKRRVLRVGCGPHSSLKIIPRLLHAFLARHPNTEIRLATSDDQSLLRDLRLGILDALLMSLPVGDGELVEEPLWSYEMVVVTPTAKARRRKAAVLDELKDLPFILYRRAVVIDSAFRQLCRELGFEPNVVMENDEPDSIKELVKLGLGVTVLPMWSVAEERQRGTLRVTELPKRNWHNYGVLYRRTGYNPTVLEDLLLVARGWRQWWPLARYVSDPV